MDTSLKGKSGKPFRMVVEEGQGPGVRPGGQVVQSRLRRRRAAEDVAGHVPGLVGVLAGARSSSPWGEAGLNWERILHGEQEFVFPGPPPAAGH